MRALLCGLAFAGVLCAAGARAQTADDPRLFGRYCGNATVERCVNVRVTFLGITVTRRRECRRFNLRDIDLRVDYTATARGGLMSGSGRALLDNDQIGVVLAGAVTGPGRVRGSATVSGLAPQLGSARLSGDGLALTVSAYNSKVTLRKDACGNASPSAAIVSPTPGTTVPFGETVVLSGEVADAEDTVFPRERKVFTSNRDGVLTGAASDYPRGLNLYTNALSPGSHIVYLLRH